MNSRIVGLSNSHIGGTMKIERFEDLKCWQEARKLRNMISDITNN